MAGRDPWKHPFSKNSIWNTPIGSGAQVVHAGIKPATEAGATIDENILIGRKDAPLRDMLSQPSNAFMNYSYRCGGSGVMARVPWPDGFMTHRNGGTPNHSGAILMPDGHTLHQSQPITRCSTTSAITSRYRYPDGDLFGDGIKGAHGGGGNSSMGGTLRLGECVPGGRIPHALQINLFARINLSTSNGGFRWPAWKADSGYNQAGGFNYYGGSNPQVRMGSLLCLKPDFNVAGLRTGAGKIIAQCMKEYGAYVVDNSAWNVWSLNPEMSPDGRCKDEFKAKWGFDITQYGPGYQPTPWSQDMRDIFTNLHCVINNSPTSIGGGGPYPAHLLVPEFGEIAEVPPVPVPAPEPVPPPEPTPEPTPVSKKVIGIEIDQAYIVYDDGSKEPYNPS